MWPYIRITVNPVLVTTSVNPIALRMAKTPWSFGRSECNRVKQATCVKQACIHFLKKANALKRTPIKQAPVLSKHIFIIP